MSRLSLVALSVTIVFACCAAASPTTKPSTPAGDQMIAPYFRSETRAIAQQCLSDVKTLRDWQGHREEYRRQLAEMLGLWPTPAKSDLKATVTGTVDHPEFKVEKLHFQSRPGLYVT